MKSEQSIYSVILAGGSGTRFWPRSRQLFPKQLCKLTNSQESMLEQTIKRVEPFSQPNNLIVVTNHLQEKITLKTLKEKQLTVLKEPETKSTSAALALAALQIKLNYNDPNAIMISTHADQVVTDQDAFINTVNEAINVAKTGRLCLVGISPTYPATNFGYIKRGEKLHNSNSYRVDSFKEKPQEDVAKEYFSEKKYYWNSGIFVWKVDTLIKELEEFSKETFLPLWHLYEKAKSQNLKSLNELPWEDITKAYKSLPKVSIDRAVLEKSQNIVVIEANFLWDDVGSWTSLPSLLGNDKNGNMLQGDVMTIDTQSSIVSSDGPFIATLGLKDLIVVADKGCILVCAKDRAQDIKKIVTKLKEKNRHDLI